ncbi:ABC transporter permease [Massilia cavernae]|uniref:ABC transporter permease n=1 Tax=Massilia cavernae TaxID=2320864 RepID=A0A418XW35_9BURK|nr:FtsX-like permease family protein [Massilia cavernae]RJG16999.1 ABC transporter permease [Massilia cavernae]
MPGTSPARARAEYRVVIGERLGHLAIVRSGSTAEGDAPLFDREEAARVRRIVEGRAGVALVLPQMSLSGMASSGERSALFRGEGIDAGTPADAPGKLKAGVRNGIAVSAGQARSLGLRNGSNVTLAGAAPHTRATPLNAEVVDIFSTAELSADARSVLMPFEMAQNLLDTVLTERFVVFLAEPAQLEEKRGELLAALRASGVAAHVRTWQEQSPSFNQEDRTSKLAFDSLAGMAFAVVAAAIAATISMNALERRREVGVLRALGMRSASIFLMFAAEALWMAAIGVVASLVASGLVAWVVNRAALSYSAHHALQPSPMLVELDFNKMSMAVVTVMAVALLAALVPAFKAARGGIAEAIG